ncbi:hypothetical protein V8C86DRAFT_1535058 [Haematococcus lacustris]
MQTDYHLATKEHQPPAEAVAPKISQLPALPQPVPRRKPQPLRTPPLGQPPSPSAPPPTAPDYGPISKLHKSALPSLFSILAKLHSLVVPTTPEEVKLYAHCRAVCEALGTAGNSCPLPDLALALRAGGWVTLVRKVVDSQAYWTKSMTNSFCYCLLPREHGSGHGPKHQGYVVDPAMKDSFLAAVVTPRYQTVWGALPDVFVGPAYQLVALLQLVCAELAACFQAQGRQLPPWRSFTATQGRWLSPSFHDVAAPAVAPSPAIAGSNLTLTCHRRASLANPGPDVSTLAAFRAACAQLHRPSVADAQQQAASRPSRRGAPAPGPARLLLHVVQGS